MFKASKQRNREADGRFQTWNKTKQKTTLTWVSMLVVLVKLSTSNKWINSRESVHVSIRSQNIIFGYNSVSMVMLFFGYNTVYIIM